MCEQVFNAFDLFVYKKSPVKAGWDRFKDGILRSL